MVVLGLGRLWRHDGEKKMIMGRRRRRGMKSKTRFWWAGLGWVGEDTDVYTLGYGCMEKGKERKIWEETR